MNFIFNINIKIFMSILIKLVKNIKNIYILFEKIYFSCKFIIYTVYMSIIMGL